MDEYEKNRKQILLENDVESLKDHRAICDADMDAHGKWLMKNDNRLDNLEKDAASLQASCKEDAKSIRKLQNFQLQLVTGGVVVGALFGFLIKLIWK